MRLTVLALALLPAAAHAQSTTLPAPTPAEPLAQTQSCPAGTSWDASAGACAEMSEVASPLKATGSHSGCSYGATARDVMS
ncbi:MAG: hypothetical protein AAGF56_11795 [Pseudomonadota bacterium]